MNTRSLTVSQLCLALSLPLAVVSVEPAFGQSEPNTDAQPIYKYVGNLFSLKFHRPSCKFARAMWRGNVVRFQYRKQAVDAGQKPCRYCLPPDWKSVGATILKTDSGLSQTGKTNLDESIDQNRNPTASRNGMIATPLFLSPDYQNTVSDTQTNQNNSSVPESEVPAPEPELQILPAFESQKMEERASLNSPNGIENSTVETAPEK